MTRTRDHARQAEQTRELPDAPVPSADTRERAVRVLAAHDALDLAEVLGLGDVAVALAVPPSVATDTQPVHSDGLARLAAALGVRASSR